LKAIQIKSHGSFDKLNVVNIDDPTCFSNQVKVKIKYSSINHLDIWIRKGVPGLDINLPRTLGSDASGTIVEIGKNVSHFKIGDDVIIQPGVFNSNCAIAKSGNEHLSPSYGILGETFDGVQSEYVCLDPINVFPMPKTCSYKEASSFGLTFMTAYEMLIKKAQIKPNDLVLIYGGTSGVGSAGIQIAKDVGCKVISTCGNINKIEIIQSLGADYVLLHNDNLYENLKDYLDKRKIDVVFEHIGARTWMTSMKVLAKGGRVVTCGATTGAKVNINLSHIFFKNLSIIGSTMGSIDTFKEVCKKIDNNIYRTVIDRVYEVSDVAKAHEYIEKRKNLGKVILKF
tara:strand:- start:457 stop:1482 length:1026 start_codon:yes stop_codon:yes gene_type:complete